jgi:hypothetical protein
MHERIHNLTHAAKLILLIAAGVLVAFLIWRIVAFVTQILFTVVELAILAAVLYVIFLIVRSAWGRQSST